MKQMKLMKSKLRSGKGFTMSELLMAVLIMSLMTLVLTSGINASTRVYNEAVTYSEKRVLLSTLSEAVMAEIRNGTDFRYSDLGDPVSNFTFTSKNYGSGAYFGVDDGMLTVKGQPLVSKGSYISGENGKIKISLSAENTMMMQPSDTTDVQITVKLTIGNESGESREFTVKPMTEQQILPASA